MTRKKKLMFIAPAAILGILLFMALGGTVVMLLWNWLLPALFGFHTITFWQAIGILALGRILFGGHGFHRSYRRRWGRWEPMTPEERERFRDSFRESMRERCGPAPGESKEQPV